MSGKTSVRSFPVEPPVRSIFDAAVVSTTEQGVGLSGTPFAGLNYTDWARGVTGRMEGAGGGKIWPSLDCITDILGCAAGEASWPIASDQLAAPAEVVNETLGGKAEISIGCNSEFRPVTVYYPDGCVENVPDGIDYAERAGRALASFDAHAAGFELSSGFGTGNPTLWSTATAIGGGPHNARDLLAEMAMAVEVAGSPGGLVLHVPSWALNEFKRFDLIDFNVEGNHWETALGWRVNPGPGLTGGSALIAPAAYAPAADPNVYLTAGLWIAKGPIRFAEADGAGETYFNRNTLDIQGDDTQAGAPRAGTRATAERQLLVAFNTNFVWSGQLDSNPAV